jgi:transcriptional regulator with XRE-family HTH domain
MVTAVAGKKSDLGPIGENVKDAVKRFREDRRLSYAELSRKLTELGRDVPPLGLRRIESGARRVDADDLAALALALSVSPLALLLPTGPSAVLPGGKRYPAEQIWDWGTGEHPLFATDDVLAFIRDSKPLNWPEIETVVVGQLRGANPNVQGAIASNISRNKAHRSRRQTVADEVARGDD